MITLWFSEITIFVQTLVAIVIKLGSGVNSCMDFWLKPDFWEFAPKPLLFRVRCAYLWYTECVTYVCFCQSWASPFYWYLRPRPCVHFLEALRPASLRHISDLNTCVPDLRPWLASLTCVPASILVIKPYNY